MKTDTSLPARIKNKCRQAWARMQKLKKSRGSQEPDAALPQEKTRLSARFRPNRKSLWRLIILLSCVLLFIAACILTHSLRGALLSQSAAERWQGESELRFAQISCFLPAGSGFDESGVHAFREKADAALIAASLEAPPEGKLLADAYSGKGSISLTGSEGSATVTALGIGGDFFLFHPLHLRFGSYLRTDDINYDRLLITEELAWKLFGAVDVAGMTVNIGATPYQVAGVVSREDDFFSEHAGAAEIEAFLPFDTLAATDNKAAITCYELIMPDPVSGFAMQTAAEYDAFKDATLLENSRRYSLAASFRVVGDFGLRSVVADDIAYPYWENAARILDDYLALIMLLTWVFAAPPAAVAIFVGVRWLHRQYARLKQRIRDARTYK